MKFKFNRRMFLIIVMGIVFGSFLFVVGNYILVGQRMRSNLEKRQFYNYSFAAGEGIGDMMQMDCSCMREVIVTTNGGFYWREQSDLYGDSTYAEDNLFEHGRDFSTKRFAEFRKYVQNDDTDKIDKMIREQYFGCDEFGDPIE